MQTTIKKVLATTGILVLTGVVFGYSFFRLKDYIDGPIVDISTPKNGQTFTSPLIGVSGSSKNLSFLNLDGRKIYTDKDGIWTEKLLLQDGVNIIEVRGVDRFGRKNVQVLRVVYDGTKQ